MKTQTALKNVTLAAVAALAGTAGVAVADPVSYAGIISAVDVSTVATGIVAMGAIMIVPNVARWAVRKLVGFFR